VSENAIIKIVKEIETYEIETTTKIVPIIETKILPEIVIVKEEEIAKGKDHAVVLVAVIVQQEDVDPDPGNEILLNLIEFN
jgi:hypothetical protein